MRGLVVFATVVVVGAAYGLYELKYEVEHLEDRLRSLNGGIADSRDAIEVLRVEWSYLNRPEYLQELATQYLDYQPIAATQVAEIDRLPFRPFDRDENELDSIDGVPVPRDKPSRAPLIGGDQPGAAARMVAYHLATGERR
ncbi:cell division protein FtsL [Oceanibacterium hippocampi]|uniref:Cell division protein FtsL n=1 Tax=Oceanibacterium hippocampi TaxID=745714 RepID=A0A1Y5SCD6_9PROT|nr:hypothetical protein [Oceanibacterium hippocampi]SLN37217.1 hypothetical protein OCH7691_01517 [Oceanibacterium hippocampi]